MATNVGGGEGARWAEGGCEIVRVGIAGQYNNNMGFPTPGLDL